LDDLKTCLQVQWRWYIIGLPLLWESFHLNLHIDERVDGNPPEDTKMFGQPLRLEKLSEYFCPPSDRRKRFQNDRLLSRCRYLNICFDDEYRFKDSPNPVFIWPVIREIISRCVNVKYLQIMLNLHRVDSPMTSSILSDIVNILAPRKFSEFDLDVRSYSNYGNIRYTRKLEYEIPLRELAPQVTDLTFPGYHGNFDELENWNECRWARTGQMSEFKRLQSLTMEMDSDNKGPDFSDLDQVRFWSSIEGLPIDSIVLVSSADRQLPSFICENKPASLPPTLTSVYASIRSVDELNVLLEGLPNLLSIKANSDMVWNGPPFIPRERILKDDPSVPEPQIVCRKLEHYEIHVLQLPLNHWRAVLTSCRQLKHLKFPVGMPEQYITLAAINSGKTLERVYFEDRRPRPMKFPIHSFVWCSKLYLVRAMASWVEMFDETLVTGLCRANPNLKYFELGGDWGHKEDNLEIVFGKLQGRWWRFLRHFAEGGGCIWWEVDNIRPYILDGSWKSKLWELEDAEETE
jgi:hypothetical protein